MARRKHYCGHEFEEAMALLGNARDYMEMAEEPQNLGRPEGDYYLTLAQRELARASRRGLDVKPEFRRMGLRFEIQKFCKQFRYIHDRAEDDLFASSCPNDKPHSRAA
jgi:hypothetical protein